MVRETSEVTVDPERLQVFSVILGSYCQRPAKGAAELFATLFRNEGAGRTRFEEDLNAILFVAGGRVEAHVVLDILVTDGLVKIRGSTLFAIAPSSESNAPHPPSSTQ